MTVPFIPAPVRAPAARGLLIVALFVARGAGAAPRGVSLREAIALAESAALPMVDARTQRDVQASQAEAAALPPLQNPSLETSVERGKYYNDVVAYAQLLLRVEVSGQRAARMREVDELVRAREARVRVASAEIAGAVAEAVGLSLAAQERVAEVERGLVAANDELRIHSARAAAGDATVVDVAYAEAEVGRWRQLLRSSEAAVIAAKARVAQLLGSADVEVRTDLAPPAAPRAETVKVPPLALALESEASASRATAERARREGTPTLDFGPRFTRGDFGELRSGIVVGGTLPLFRRNQAEIARAEAESARSSKLKEIVASNVAVRTRAAYERAAIARETLADLDAHAIPAAERTVSAAQEAFRAGKGDFFRVLLARRDLVTTRMRRLDVLELAWSAYAELLSLGAIDP